MFVGGPIIKNENTRINTANWEYQISDTQWSTYPQSLSALIQRQCRNACDNNTNVPIFYQTSNGNKFKLNPSNSLQYNLQNNSVTMIRKQKKSKISKIDYLKCPECLFKIFADTKICEVCNTNIPKYINENNDANSKAAEQKENDSKMISNSNHIQELPPKLNPVVNELSWHDFIYINLHIFIRICKTHSDELLCPICSTKNSKEFDFCVGCSFDLREYKKNLCATDLVVDIKGDEDDSFDIEPGRGSKSDDDMEIEENEVQPGVEESEKVESTLEFAANWH